MTIKKIVILNSFSHEYLHEMCSALAQGFIQEGVDVRQVDADGEDNMVRQRIEQLQPDMVFEINRTRNQSAQLTPKEVIHVAWIQDAWMNSGSGKPKQLHCYDPHFGGSDITYTLLDPGYFSLATLAQQGVWGSLSPGANHTIFHPTDSMPEVDTAAICGYIPLPPHKQNIDGIALGWNHGRQYSSERMADYLLNTARISINRHSYPDIHEIIAAELARDLGFVLSGEQFARPLDKSWLLLYLDTELPRIRDRLALGTAALNTGLALSIYGQDNWQEWPTLAPYYRGLLNWKSDLAETYRQTQFNLHNGALGMHSRVLDCMACGGSVFANRTPDLQQYFVDGEHYISYQAETLDETLASWRGRHQQLRDIGINASEELRRNHTWQHRAREILADLQAVIPATSAADR
jgi:hypothetical protein